LTHSEKIATLRAQVARTEWHTEKLQLLGLEESYLDSYFLGESLRSQLHEALVGAGQSTSVAKPG
jgi:hypothetical protein